MEHIPTNPNEQATHKPTGKTLEQYKAEKRAREQAAQAQAVKVQQQQPSPAFQQFQQAQRPQQVSHPYGDGVPSFPTQQPTPTREPNIIPTTHNEAQILKTEKGHRRLRNMPVALRVAAGLAVLGAAGGVVYEANPGDIQNSAALGFISNNKAEINGITTVHPDKLGLKSLALDQCTNPSAAYMIMTVSGEFPLIPSVPTAESKAAVKVQPYMTEKNAATITDTKDQNTFRNLITNDHYQHFTVNNLPLALQICDPGTAVTKDGNKVTIDHSKIRITVEDPLTMLKNYTIKPVFQTTSAEMPNLHPTEGEYITIPDALYPNVTGDDTFAKNITDLSESMHTAPMIQAMLTSAETSIVNQLNSAVSGDNGITFPYGADTFQDAADKAIVQRVTGNPSNIPKIIGSDASITMDAPVDASKQAYSIKDLKGFDTSAETNITSIKIETGGMEALKPTESTPPPTSPTPSATTTK